MRKQTATHRNCNTLQHAATHCNTPQHTATHRNTLQRTATHFRDAVEDVETAPPGKFKDGMGAIYGMVHVKRDL